LHQGPQAASEALRQDFLNATTVSAQKILHAEEAKITSDDQVTHALTHMTVEWATKYSNDRGGEDVAPWVVHNDRAASYDAYNSFMEDSFVQDDKALTKRSLWSNFFRFKSPEIISNNELQERDKHFESLRKTGGIEIPKTVPSLPNVPNEANDNSALQLKAAWEASHPSAAEAIMRENGACLFDSLAEKVTSNYVDLLPSAQDVPGYPTEVKLTFFDRNEEEGRGRNPVVTDAPVPFASVVVPKCPEGEQ
jgi:hypothetical protein